MELCATRRGIDEENSVIPSAARDLYLLTVNTYGGWYYFHLTKEQIRAFGFTDDFYPANPLPPP